MITVLSGEFLSQAALSGIGSLGVASALPEEAPGPYGPDREEARAKAEADYLAWLDSGGHADMNYLVAHFPFKFRPEKLRPGCRSVIVAAFPYFQAQELDDKALPSGSATAPAGYGRVARYAWGRDYHKTVLASLRGLSGILEKEHPGHWFQPWTDAHPLHERYFAHSSGIGFSSRNSLVIVKGHGTWVLLGIILTDAVFKRGLVAETDFSGKLVFSTEARPLLISQSARHCPSSCRRCSSICPTGALDAQGRVTAGKCIAYLTIEHKGSIPEELRPLMGDWVYGCDLCQEVCPFNVRRFKTEVRDFLNHKAGPLLSLTEILSIEDDEAYRKRFAGSPLMRPKREGLLRNACVAAANSGATDCVPLLEALLSDPSPVLREHARWALDRLAARAADKPTSSSDKKDAGAVGQNPGFRDGIPPETPSGQDGRV